MVPLMRDQRHVQSENTLKPVLRKDILRSPLRVDHAIAHQHHIVAISQGQIEIMHDDNHSASGFRQTRCN